MKNIKDPYISKNLKSEMNIRKNIAYFEIVGASSIDNYRSPDSYVFLLIESSTGIHTIDYIDYKQNDHQIRVSFPGQIHSWRTGHTAKGHKLIVSKQFIEKSVTSPLFFSLRSNQYPVIDLDKKNFLELEKIFIDIKTELSFRVKRKIILRLKVQLAILLINDQIERRVEYQNVGKMVLIIQKFDKLLEEHYKVLKTVKGYADFLCISPNYLNILCQKNFNMSAKKIINQRIILEAKRLLQGSTMTIKEIAFDLGFVEVAHFSTFMKSKTGISPKQYRE